MTRKFTVSAVNQAIRTVAKTHTKSAHNAYRLEVSPGHYELVAKSQGLVCRASATAFAHRTDTAKHHLSRALILAVTPNPALDITYEIARVRWHEASNRVESVARRAGERAST